MSETKTTQLAITGMHCVNCAQSIEKALRRVEGVAEANVNFAAETARVTFDPQMVETDALVRAVEDAGYSARAQDADRRRDPAGRRRTPQSHDRGRRHGCK